MRNCANLFFLLFALACKDNAGETLNEHIKEEPYIRETLKDWTEGDYYLDFPLDTAELIADLHLIDHVDRTDLILDDPEIDLLSDTLDTLIMSRIAYGCICADWRDLTCQTGTGEYGFGNSCEYYIEPAHKDLEIRVPFVGGDHTIQFIGKKYLKPVEDEEKGEASHGGLAFKYYSFEFIKPYSVYGPMYNDTLFTSSGDTILQTYSTQLTVE